MGNIPAPPDPPSAPYSPYPYEDEPRTILGLTAKEDKQAFIFAMTLLIIVLIGFVIVMSRPQPVDLCRDPNSFTCLDHRVEECVASEKYSKEECVILVGGNK